MKRQRSEKVTGGNIASRNAVNIITQKVSASRAILQGLSAEGGLFVPEQLPKFSEQHLEKMVSQDYIRRAQEILGEFLSDFSSEEIESCFEPK